MPIVENLKGINFVSFSQVSAALDTAITERGIRALRGSFGALENGGRANTSTRLNPQFLTRWCTQNRKNLQRQNCALNGSLDTILPVTEKPIRKTLSGCHADVRLGMNR